MRWLMFFLTLPFLAVAGQDDVYATLELGNRVEVTFHSGHTLVGDLIAVPENAGERTSTIDYSKVDRITLNVGWEYPGLNGTMTIRKDQLKSIRKLRRLDPVTLKRLQKEKEKAMVELAKREKVRQIYQASLLKRAMDSSDRAAATKSAKEAKKDDVRRLDALRKGLELLAKYPPPDWGPHRLQVIQKKNLTLVPMTAAERGFLTNFVLWMAAYNYRESQQ